MKCSFLSIVVFSLAAAAVSAQSLQITQVDTGNLLLRGTIDAYVSVSRRPASDSPLQLDPETFTAAERVESDRKPLDIIGVTADATREMGINFLLLIDNSGSMYDPLDGERRIDHAKKALEAFIDSMSGSNDQAALGAFNTYLNPLARLGASTGELVRSLERIEQPESEEAYTELYQALVGFLPELAAADGRKAVIVLSDGENYPFSEYSGTEHPVWKDALVSPDEVVRAYREEEVTLYAINFAEVRDRNLSRIAYETGGAVFDARGTTDLTTVYKTIRDSIRSEVRLTIRIPASYSAERNLSVGYGGATDEISYFAPLLLGRPGDLHWFIPLLVALGAAGALAGLHFLRLESAAKRPEIQVLGEGAPLPLDEEVTVIGSAPDAHLTIAGNPGIDQQHAKVVRDEKSGRFTLVSERPVRVNNTLVKNRPLKPGDVIGIEDVTIVFDAGETAGDQE